MKYRVIQLYVAANLRLIEFSMLGPTVFVRALPHSSCSLRVPLQGPSHLIELIFFGPTNEQNIHTHYNCTCIRRLYKTLR